MVAEAKRTARVSAKEFAHRHLAVCAQDVLGWRRSGRLADEAVLRELAHLCEHDFPG